LSGSNSDKRRALHGGAALIKRVPPTTPQQPELFTVETVQGYGSLGRKERTFVQALFEGCNQTEAGRRAGIIGSDEYIRKAACKLATKGNVQALMNQAWAKSGASIDDTLMQAAELQRLAFGEAKEAPTAERRKAAADQWVKTSALIASIHGRLNLNVSGSVAHTHTGEVAFVLPPSALPVLAQMRRDVLANDKAQTRST
jgi:phage terminase small subunit